MSLLIIDHLVSLRLLPFLLSPFLLFLLFLLSSFFICFLFIGGAAVLPSPIFFYGCAAAAIVLMKDDFAAVAEGVKEGRLIFANLRKVSDDISTHTSSPYPFTLSGCILSYLLLLSRLIPYDTPSHTHHDTSIMSF